MAFENIATGMEAYFQHPTDPKQRMNGIERLGHTPEDWVPRVGPVSIDLECIDGKAIGLHVVRLGRHARPSDPLAIVRPAPDDSENWVAGTLDIAAAYQAEPGVLDTDKAIDMIRSMADHITDGAPRADRAEVVALTAEWFANAGLLPVNIESEFPDAWRLGLAQAEGSQELLDLTYFV